MTLLWEVSRSIVLYYVAIRDVSSGTFYVHGGVVYVLSHASASYVYVRYYIVGGLLYLYYYLDCSLVHLDMYLLRSLVLASGLYYLGLYFLSRYVYFYLHVYGGHVSIHGGLLVAFSLVQYLRTGFTGRLVRVLLVCGGLYYERQLGLAVSISVFFGFFGSLFGATTRYCALLFSFVFSLDTVSATSNAGYSASPPGTTVSHAMIRLGWRCSVLIIEGVISVSNFVL